VKLEDEIFTKTSLPIMISMQKKALKMLAPEKANFLTWTIVFGVSLVAVILILFVAFMVFKKLR
jgi:hypothetical protein